MDRGRQKPIYNLSPHESKKALGVEDCHAGGSAEQLGTIKSKVGDWINRMKNGHLPAKCVWVTYKFQLWPSIRYGIGTVRNDMEEAEELLNDHDSSLLNILGIARTAKKGWKKLHTIFGGFGFRNLATEQLICRKTEPATTALQHL